MLYGSAIDNVINTIWVEWLVSVKPIWRGDFWELSLPDMHTSDTLSLASNENNIVEWSMQMSKYMLSIISQCYNFTYINS